MKALTIGILTKHYLGMKGRDMAGTKTGGQKAANTNRRKYGADFYSRIAKLVKTRPGGFANNRELAIEAGRKGGKISRRGKVAPPIH